MRINISETKQKRFVKIRELSFHHGKETDKRRK